MATTTTSVITSVLSSNWTITIIGGAVAAIIGGYWVAAKKGWLNKNVNHNQQSIIINNQPTHPMIEKNEPSEKLKISTKILFVDNDRGFEKMVKILQGAGWKSTKLITDIKDTDRNDINETDIFFIDIHDVGRKLTPKDEGLGLAGLLKDKYPSKKVVIYSADPDGDRSHPALQKVDGFLRKSAEPSEFIRLMERFVSTKK